MNLNNGGYAMPDDHIEPDMPPMEYTDDDGLHVMCSCGHYASGGVKAGDKIATCPNCSFLGKFQRILVVYPEQLPERLRR